MRRAAILLGPILFLAGCASMPVPTGTGSPPTPPTSTPDASEPPAAALSIEATGLVGCDWMLGCGALLSIQPEADPLATLPPGWRPSSWIDLAVDAVPEGGGRTLEVGAPRHGPSTLDHGTYRVVAAWTSLDDSPSISPGIPAEPPITTLGRTCQTDLAVTDGTTVVSISVAFALDGTCAVAAVAS